MVGTQRSAEAQQGADQKKRRYPSHVHSSDSHCLPNTLVETRSVGPRPTLIGRG
jgi:hypothetical protein